MVNEPTRVLAHVGNMMVLLKGWVSSTPFAAEIVVRLDYRTCIDFYNLLYLLV
jgi:hypothetical protein